MLRHWLRPPVRDELWYKTSLKRLRRLPHPSPPQIFFREHRGQPLASSALMAPMSRGFVAELDRFAARHRLPVVLFAKGQRKDDVMAEHLRRFAAEEGVLFIGKAQERALVFRTQKRCSPA